MLAAIRKFFRTPAALTRQRQQGASQDDPDLEASSIGEAGQQLDDNSQEPNQHQHQAGDEGGRIKGHKKRRWSKLQGAKHDSNRDRRRASGQFLVGGQGANKGRGPACGGLGDSGSDTSTSGSSSSNSSSSSSSSDTTSSSSGSNSSCGSGISGNNSELNNKAGNLIQEEDKLHSIHAAAAALPGAGQPATGVAECGDCLQQQQQQKQTGHYDASELQKPNCEQPQMQKTQAKARKDNFNFNFVDDNDEAGEEADYNEVDNEEDDEDNFTAEDQNRVAFIAEVGSGNANRQHHHHYLQHYHHQSHSQQVATSPTNSSLQVNATPMQTSASSGAPFHANAAVTPGTMPSATPRKTDVDQLLTGATSLANQRRDSVRGNLEELRVAESVNYRPVVYKYSFKIPDTPANMRVFTDPDDRRIEAIARSCDSQIHLEKLPVRAGGGQSALKMRKITIQSPDLHSLEKCCRQFDDRFKHFYVSGGLGLSGKSIQRVYVDELDN